MYSSSYRKDFYRLLNREHLEVIENTYSITFYDEDSVGPDIIKFKKLKEIEDLDYIYSKEINKINIIEITIIPDSKIEDRLHFKEVLEDAIKDSFLILNKVISDNNLDRKNFEISYTDMNYFSLKAIRRF